MAGLAVALSAISRLAAATTATAKSIQNERIARRRDVRKRDAASSSSSTAYPRCDWSGVTAMRTVSATNESIATTAIVVKMGRRFQ